MAIPYAEPVVDKPCGFKRCQYWLPPVYQAQIGYYERGGPHPYYPGGGLLALLSTMVVSLLIMIHLYMVDIDHIQVLLMVVPGGGGPPCDWNPPDDRSPPSDGGLSGDDSPDNGMVMEVLLIEVIWTPRTHEPCGL